MSKILKFFDFMGPCEIFKIFLKVSDTNQNLLKLRFWYLPESQNAYFGPKSAVTESFDGLVFWPKLDPNIGYSLVASLPRR